MTQAIHRPMASRCAVLLLLAATASAAAGDPTLSVKRLADDTYELTLDTDRTAELAQAQGSLFPAARQLCGSKQPKLGKYKYHAKQPLQDGAPETPGIVLQQVIHCVAATAAPPARVAPLPPAAHDDAQIEKLTLAFLAARDAGKYDDAYAMLAPLHKQGSTYASWRQRLVDFNAKAGKTVSRRIKKVTWYDNPPNSPAPGTYAAADFVSEFENLAAHCGYIVWFTATGETFGVMREEENYLDKEAAAKVPPEQRKAFADRFGC